jgi:hypothetical protein
MATHTGKLRRRQHIAVTATVISIAVICYMYYWSTVEYSVLAPPHRSLVPQAVSVRAGRRSYRELSTAINTVVNKSVTNQSNEIATQDLLEVTGTLYRGSYSEWFSAARVERGLYVRDATQLRNRLTKANSLQICNTVDQVIIGVAITKGDARFLQEWIVFHLWAGYKHIFIYHNVEAGGDSDNTEEAAQPFIDEGHVTLLPWPGRGMQDEAYNHALKFLQRSSCDGSSPGPWCGHGVNTTVWMATHDVDEYLFREDGLCVQDLLSDYSDFGGLLVYKWDFGAHLHFLEPENAFVVESYLMRHPLVNPECKVMANTRFTAHNMHPHRFAYTDYRFAVDQFWNADFELEENYIHRGLNKSGPIRIHHYSSRSIEALLFKTFRGRAHIDAFRTPAEFRSMLATAVFANVTDNAALLAVPFLRTVLLGEGAHLRAPGLG